MKLTSEGRTWIWGSPDKGTTEMALKTWGSPDKKLGVFETKLGVVQTTIWGSPDKTWGSPDNGFLKTPIRAPISALLGV